MNVIEIAEKYGHEVVQEDAEAINGFGESNLSMSFKNAYINLEYEGRNSKRFKESLANFKKILADNEAVIAYLQKVNKEYTEKAKKFKLI